MTPDPGSLLPVALQAAGIAADMMRTRRPASETEKHDRDLVSDVDLAIERQVRAHLAEATPDIGFLGEEEGQSGGPAGGWLWMLDPIDGTSNFAHGIPLCATSLALLHDGRPILGVIDAPFLGLRYHALDGHGAYAGESRMSASGTDRLRDARCLLFDFDGPVCDLAGAMPADTADRLRGFALDHGVQVPGDSEDPSDIIALAAGHDPGLAGLLDAMLASFELAAVSHATVPGYVHEALAACRDSGRTSAVIGPQSPKAVRGYLERHGLYDQTGCVVTPGSHPPGHLMTLDHVVESALSALEATPAECALITASSHGIETAFAVGAQPIGYARTPADRDRLTDAGATCIIPSLADLTLRLRAGPLPN